MTAPSPTPEPVEVLFGGNVVSTITPPDGSTMQAQWIPYTTLLNVAKAGTYTLEFEGTVANPSCGVGIADVPLASGAGTLAASSVLTVAGQSTAAAPAEP